MVLCEKSKKRDGCGLLQLYEITKPDLLYRKYFYRSATNDTMRKDLKDVVTSVNKIAQPKKNDLIIDIGSNEDELLVDFLQKIPSNEKCPFHQLFPGQVHEKRIRNKK